MHAKKFLNPPRIELIQSEAEALWAAQDEPATLERVRKWKAQLNGPGLDKNINSSVDSRDQARQVIACEYGFKAWADLEEIIQGLNKPGSDVWKFEAAADAIIDGNAGALQLLLLQTPALVEMRSLRNHHAPLMHYAAANGVEDFRQKTPLNIVEITQILVRHGAEPDAQTQEYGSAATALGLAASSCHPAYAGVQLELLRSIMEAGACLNGAPGGWAPIISALRNGRGDAAKFLADCGASLDLESAAGAGHIHALKGMLSNEDLKSEGSSEKLAYGFAWACAYGHVEVADYMLAWGFVPDYSFMRGQTPLHWAAYGGWKPVVELLQKANHPINVVDKVHEGSPLDWALHGWQRRPPEFKANNYYDVVEALVQEGAKIDPRLLTEPGWPVSQAIKKDARMAALLGIRI
jgi:ankyrin repeat protein